MKNLLLLVALCVLGLSACKKEHEDKPGSANTLTVSVNGKSYTSSSKDFVMFIDTITARSTDQVTNLAYEISGPMSGGQQVGLYINTIDGKLPAGQYTNTTDGENAMYWSETLNARDFYTTTPQYGITINVTRSDSSFIEGTFSGKLAYTSDGTKTVELTSGQFKVDLKSPYIVHQRL